MALSPIQSKEQHIKNSRGESWKQRKEGWTKFKNCGVGNIWGLYNIGGARNPPPTMTHKELFWKKDALVV